MCRSSYPLLLTPDRTWQGTGERPVAVDRRRLWVSSHFCFAEMRRQPTPCRRQSEVREPGESQKVVHCSTSQRPHILEAPSPRVSCCVRTARSGHGATLSQTNRQTADRGMNGVPAKSTFNRPEPGRRSRSCCLLSAAV